MNIRDELSEYIINVCLKGAVPDEFSNEYDLIENEVMDSLTTLGFINHIEQTYNIEFGEDDITPENFASSTMLSKFIEGKLS